MLRAASLVVLVLVLGVALAVGGLARGASPNLGVHGVGTLTRSGFTDRYWINVTRHASGNVSGHIRAEGATWMAQASPTGLSISFNSACITGVVERGFNDLGTPQSIVILIADVPDGRDLITSALLDAPPDEPPFACAALARGMEIFHPELTTGDFRFIGN